MRLKVFAGLTRIVVLSNCVHDDFVVSDAVGVAVNNGQIFCHQHGPISGVVQSGGPCLTAWSFFTGLTLTLTSSIIVSCMVF